jgi:hypothetical protein
VLRVIANRSAHGLHKADRVNRTSTGNAAVGVCDMP